MLVRSRPWVELNKAALTNLLRPMFKALSVRLVRVKLGQIVPIAGIVVGAGMNYAMIDRVGTTAHWAYRERFLRDKGYPFLPVRPVDTPTQGPDDDTISVIHLAEEEGLELPDDLSS